MNRILWLVTAAAYGVLLLGAAGWPTALLGALFAVSTVLGTLVLPGRSLPWRGVFVVVQLGLGYLVFASAGASAGATLLLIVLVVQAGLLLPLAGALAVAVVIPFAHLGMEWRDTVREGLGTLTATLLAVAVTWLLRRERETRRALVAQAEELATTQERNRVARDIHDGLGHYLTVLQMQVRAGRALLPSDAARADAVLGQAEEQAREALGEVRRSVAALREPRVALAARLERLGAAVDVDGVVRALAPDVEEALFRAAQEGLTNARKHARATSVSIVLAYTDGEVRLAVRDDGVGTATPVSGGVGTAAGGSGVAGGFGLVGVGERMAALGGTLTLESSPGAGTTLTVSAPA
ncbi:sensor histidine kinase [Cryptosporangium arvum]|uniref:sensor histidine kinase n=1 Tax=Cryptosporangium arvum TaxID=80871 RepID=UPI0004B0D835|nr:sensor histidine kinase [Cryptosporangium arvum]